MTSFVSVEIPRRTPDGCFGDDRILLHTNARFQTVDSSGKKKERKKPANCLNELYNRQGVRKKKKICCGFVRNTTTAQTGIDFLPARARKK
jgi:hypothetical protein